MASSCASIISGSRQIVKFNSTPANAIVYIDGKESGITPMQSNLTRNDDHEVEIRLAGYKPYQITLTRKFNAWYIGNVLFGGVVGLIVDPMTGSIFNLTPKELSATLDQNLVSKTHKSEIYISVSMQVDTNWQKVGQLEAE